MELEPFIEFYAPKQRDRLLANPQDTSFNLNYTINPFFNSLAGEYQRKIAKLLFDTIKPFNETYGKDILSPETFNVDFIKKILYLVLYWETNIANFFVPPSCNTRDEANHLCHVDDRSANQYPLWYYDVYRKNLEHPEYSSVRRTFQFKPIILMQPFSAKDMSNKDFNHKSLQGAMYNPMCDTTYDRWMDEYHVNESECHDPKSNAEYCHPEVKVCVRKCAYGLHPKTEGGCVCVTDPSCAGRSCPAGTGFTTDPDYRDVVNATDDSSLTPGSFVGLATIAGNGVIKDYYSSLTNSPMLFYYAEGYTDMMSLSPNGRFRVSTSNELQACNEFNVIRNYVMRGYNVYLTDRGVLYVSTAAGGAREWESFDLSKKWNAYTSTSTGPDVQLEIDFSEQTRKQRWITSNGLFFVEVHVAINRISVYFNLFNSSVFCYLFLIDQHGSESYDQQLAMLFQVYQTYCRFLRETDFFVNQKMCPCFDDEYCLQQIIPTEEQDAVKNTVAYYTLYCVTRDCVQLYSTDLSAIQLKLGTCPKSIDICINSINAYNSDFTNVNLNVNCGNQCGSGCLSGFTCVNGQCVPPPPPKPTPTPIPSKTISNWYWWSLIAFVVIVLVMIVMAILYLQKKKSA